MQLELVKKNNMVQKIQWSGVLVAVQPRIRLGRSFDQRSHTYLGYAPRVRGSVGNEAREFLVGVGEGAHAKHHFQVGDTVSGEALPVSDPRLETVEFYKVSDLKVTARNVREGTEPPLGAVFHRLFRSTANEVIGDLRHEPTRTSARAASGDAIWRSRSSLTSGTRASAAIEPRPSATALVLVLFTIGGSHVAAPNRNAPAIVFSLVVCGEQIYYYDGLGRFEAPNQV